jgi:dienelactone hydrolase
MTTVVQPSAREARFTTVDHIPTLWVMPESQPSRARLVIWLPYFTGTKEEMLPYLRDLADAGFVALSFDPWGHGERGSEPAEQMGARVFSNFRRHMWPILGQTALDALRVMDWSIEHLRVTSEIAVGGVSMGGDIAVAIAGLDQRVRRVATIVATPDWLRPGMSDIQEPDRLVDPGEADAYAQLFYDRIDPYSHPAHYAHCPAMTFECGALDTHVPPDGALRFKTALQDVYQHCPDRLRVNLHPGTGHVSANPVLWRNCMEWFKHF